MSADRFGCFVLAPDVVNFLPRGTDRAPHLFSVVSVHLKSGFYWVGWVAWIGFQVFVVDKAAQQKANLNPVILGIHFINSPVPEDLVHGFGVSDGSILSFIVRHKTPKVSHVDIRVLPQHVANKGILNLAIPPFRDNFIDREFLEVIEDLGGKHGKSALGSTDESFSNR